MAKVTPPPLTCLAIETATTQASIALQVGECLLTAEEHTLNRHAEWLLEAISDLLHQANRQLSDLDGIAFDQGPGSFTGLRIGCAVAKGLALGANVLLYPVGSLTAIAKAVDTHDRILAVIDARMQEWYWQAFENGRPHGEVQVSTPQAIHVSNHGWCLAGVGVRALYEQLPVAVQQNILRQEECAPRAAALLAVVTSGGCQALSPMEAKPLYVRNQVAHQGGAHG